MIIFFLGFFFACTPEHALKYEKVVEEVIVVEEIVVVEETIYEEIILDAEDIWVDYFVQLETYDEIDVVWVIDGSGSMNDDEERLLEGIDVMMRNLPPTGWRLVMVPSGIDSAGGETQFPLLPGDDYTDAKIMYDNLGREVQESGFDGIYSYMADNSYSASWMRSDAALLVVFVSDEDDQSRIFSEVIDFTIWYEFQRKHVFLASIINFHPNDSDCNISPVFHGDRYEDATNYFNGQVVDICDTDWSPGVIEATSQIELKDTIVLTHEPLDSGAIVVFIDGVKTDEWTYNPFLNKVTLNDTPPELSLVEVAYYYKSDDTGR